MSNQTTLEIVSKLTHAAATYYGAGLEQGASPLSDEQYDALRDDLEKLDPSHPFLSAVGAPVSGAEKKVWHLSPMLSLRKVTSAAELEKWWGKVTGTGAARQTLTPVVAAIQPKLDGSSLELQYRGGTLIRAATRGDGLEGEDVMATVQKMGNVPKSLEFPFTGAVRGEVILTREAWAVADPAMATNARNVGNGILRRESDSSQAHLLTFLAYSVFSPGGVAATEAEVERWLHTVGFATVPTIFTQDLAGSSAAVEKVRAMRETLPYDIDGAVLRANILAIHDELGVSSGRPHAQIAYKWPSVTAVTTVLDVNLSVGHTGTIIPTAKLKPVPLGGVTVSSALMNNFNEVEALGVAIGDTVEVIRSGELIPKLLRVVERGAGRQPIVEPHVCPVCGAPARRAVNPSGSTGANTVCTGDVCPAKSTGKVKRWLKSVDILGIGDDLLANLMTDQVDTPADLYRLTVESLRNVPMGVGRVGESRATSIVASIQAKRTLTIDQFIGSLGVPYLGKRRVEILREQAGEGQLDTVARWQDTEHLARVLGPLLPAMASHIVAWFRDNQALVADMTSVVAVAAPVCTLLTNPNPNTSMNTEDKKVFVLTGKFDEPKASYHAAIEAAGHAFEGDISPRTTHLVQSDPASESNKSKKAKQKGIPVISVAELRELITPAT